MSAHSIQSTLSTPFSFSDPSALSNICPYISFLQSLSQVIFLLSLCIVHSKICYSSFITRHLSLVIPHFFAFPSLHSPFKRVCFVSNSPFCVILPPSAYGLRPITYSFFFRLETLFLTFLVLLYYIMNQLFIYLFYTNRPRFV